MDQPVDLSFVQVFNMLPSSVQSKMAPFRLESIRKTCSLPMLPRRSTDSRLPIPSYSEPPSTNPSAPESVWSDDSDLSNNTTITSNTITSNKHQQFETSLPMARHDRRREQRLPQGFDASSFDATNIRWSPSGIKWRYARQGAHLTAIASEEMNDSGFERRSYIDGVAYFLRACPDNLTELETDIFLRSAPWLAERARPPRQMSLRRPSDRGKSFLHRGVQWSVFAIVVVVHAAWCFLLNVARFGAYYERQYNISHHILARGTLVANAVGKHSVILSGRISSFSDGRVAQLMTGFAAWTVDSLTSGIQDGFGDGIVRIGRQPQIDPADIHPWNED